MGDQANIVYFYFKNGTNFHFASNLTGFGGDVWAVDVTADG